MRILTYLHPSFMTSRRTTFKTSRTGLDSISCRVARCVEAWIKETVRFFRVWLLRSELSRKPGDWLEIAQSIMETDQEYTEQ